MKDSYVLKRILIGVSIGVILMCIRSCDVFAESGYLQSSNIPNQCRYLTSTNSTLANGTLATDNGMWYCNPPNGSWSQLSGNIYGTWFSYQPFNSNMTPQNFVKLHRAYRITFQAQMTSSGGLNDKVNSIIAVKFGIGTTVPDRMNNCYFEKNTTCEMSNGSCNLQIENYNVTCDIEDFAYGGGLPSYIVIYFKHIGNQKLGPSMSKSIEFQEYTSNTSIENNINSQDFDISDFQTDNDSATKWNDTFGTMSTSLTAIPGLILTKFRDSLMLSYQNDYTFTIEKNNLPLKSYITYDNDLTLKPLREYITDIIGSTWYEFIGGLIGGFLLMKVLIKKGKSIFAMFSFKDNQQELWGGLE